jgi:hypothetical protein
VPAEKPEDRSDNYDPQDGVDHDAKYRGDDHNDHGDHNVHEHDAEYTRRELLGTVVIQQTLDTGQGPVRVVPRARFS